MVPVDMATRRRPVRPGACDDARRQQGIPAIQTLRAGAEAERRAKRQRRIEAGAPAPGAMDLSAERQDQSTTTDLLPSLSSFDHRERLPSVGEVGQFSDHAYRFSDMHSTLPVPPRYHQHQAPAFQGVPQDLYHPPLDIPKLGISCGNATSHVPTVASPAWGPQEQWFKYQSHGLDDEALHLARQPPYDSEENENGTARRRYPKLSHAFPNPVSPCRQAQVPNQTSIRSGELHHNLSGPMPDDGAIAHVHKMEHDTGEHREAVAFCHASGNDNAAELGFVEEPAHRYCEGYAQTESQQRKSPFVTAIPNPNPSYIQRDENGHVRPSIFQSGLQPSEGYRNGGVAPASTSGLPTRAHVTGHQVWCNARPSTSDAALLNLPSPRTSVQRPHITSPWPSDESYASLGRGDEGRFFASTSNLGLQSKGLAHTDAVAQQGKLSLFSRPVSDLSHLSRPQLVEYQELRKRLEVVKGYEVSKLEMCADMKNSVKMNLRGRARLEAWLSKAKPPTRRALSYTVDIFRMDPLITSLHPEDRTGAMLNMTNEMLRVCDALMKRTRTKDGRFKWSLLFKLMDKIWELEDPHRAEHADIVSCARLEQEAKDLSALTW